MKKNSCINKMLIATVIATIAGGCMYNTPAYATPPTPTVNSLGGDLTSTYFFGEENDEKATTNFGINYIDSEGNVKHSLFNMITNAPVNGRYTLSEESGTYMLTILDKEFSITNNAQLHWYTSSHIGKNFNEIYSGTTLLAHNITYGTSTIFIPTTYNVGDGSIVNADFLGNRLNAAIDFIQPTAGAADAKITINLNSLGNTYNPSVSNPVIGHNILLNSGHYDITGDFIGNTIARGYGIWGGLIRMYGNDKSASVDNLNADFIGNVINATKQQAYINGFAELYVRENNISNVRGIYANNSITYNFSTSKGPQYGVFGGALYSKLFDGATLNIANSLFSSNTSVTATDSVRGGAIYLVSDTATPTIKPVTNISNTDFYGNSISGGTGPIGSAIYIDGVDVYITDSNFVDNEGNRLINAVNSNITISAVDEDVIFNNPDSMDIAFDTNLSLNAQNEKKLTLNQNIISDNATNNLYINTAEGATGSVIISGELGTSSTPLDSLIIKKGTLHLKNDAASSGVTTLYADGGTLNLQDDTISTFEIDNLTENTGATGLKLALDYKGSNNTIDTIQFNTYINPNASITLDAMYVLSDWTDSATSKEVTYVTSGGSLDLVAGVLQNAVVASSNATSGNYIYTFSTTGDYNEKLTVTRAAAPGDAGLLEYIQDASLSVDSFTITTNNYNPFSDTTETELGTLDGENRTFTIQGGETYKSITGLLDDGETKGGGIVIGESQTLNINNLNEFKNFETVVENNGGTVNITNVAFDNNSIDIDNNSGTVQFSGTNSANVIQNEGTISLQGTNVLGSVTGDDGSFTVVNGNTTVTTLTQNTVDIEAGKLSVNSISAANGVNNEGQLELTGSYNTNEVTGNGEMIISSNVTNTGSIENTITIGNGYSFTTNADLILNTVENNAGTLNVSGGTITKNISGSGAINLTGELITNNANISLGTINISEDTIFNNTATASSSDTTENKGLINNGIIINSGTLNSSGGSNNGQIYSTGDFVINGNFDNTNGTVIASSITNDGGTITTYANNLESDVINDGNLKLLGGTTQGDISGNGYTNINGDLLINNTIAGNTINLNSGIITFGSNADISNSQSFNINGGSIDLLNGKISDINMGNVVLNDNINVALDVDLSSEVSDSFTTNLTSNNHVFNINNVNIIGTTLKDNIKISLGESTKLGNENIQTINTDLPSIVTPIRRIDGRIEDGYVIYAPAGNSYDDFNPSIVASPVAAQFGGYLTQLNSYDEAFRNMDNMMLMGRMQRKSIKYKNRNAINDNKVTYNATRNVHENNSVWIRPYTTFEKVNLNNGPKVSNIAYGTYVGDETGIIELSHGWDAAFNVYVGYNGSHQNYQGISVYQNGGTIGTTATAYKGNFFTGLTVNAGASAGEAHTWYGNDNFAMLMAGIASKTGYNIELAKGKFIIQPSYLMSYSFVNTFDYTNAAGVKIESDPLHAIQIEPGLKFIGNLKNGWQPYLGVSMVWNIMDKTKFKANDVALPNMSIKPYVKYGVGIRKNWGERFTGFFQTYITNGGRNGVGLQAGFRWQLGK